MKLQELPPKEHRRFIFPALVELEGCDRMRQSQLTRIIAKIIVRCMPPIVRFCRHAMHDFSKGYVAEKRKRVHEASLADFGKFLKEPGRETLESTCNLYNAHLASSALNDETTIDLCMLVTLKQIRLSFVVIRIDSFKLLER